jgi:hypothetical protein
MSLSYKRGRSDALSMVPGIAAFCRWYAENDGASLQDMVKGLTIDDASMFSYYASREPDVKRAIMATLAIAEPKTQSESEGEGVSSSVVEHVSETAGMESGAAGECLPDLRADAESKEPIPALPCGRIISREAFRGRDSALRSARLMLFMRENYEADGAGYTTLSSVLEKVQRDSRLAPGFRDLYCLGKALSEGGYEVKQGFITHLCLRERSPEKKKPWGGSSPWMSANM